MGRVTLPRGLYAIADTTYLNASNLVAASEQALRGGATTLQYRDKSSDPEQRAANARALRALCRRYGVCFLINDDATLAETVAADGVHVGRDDAAVKLARAQLGSDKIVGVSCYNELSRARQAKTDGADYIAFGSFFPSRTKPSAAHANPSLLRDAREFGVPLVAIGGITVENGGALIAAGADALAVISGVFDQADIENAARRYAALFKNRDDS